MAALDAIGTGRRLGRTDLFLTPLGLGGSSIGNLYRPVTEEDAREAVAAAYDGGIRYFDTAPLYGGGIGEHRVGQALRRRPRDDFVLSTKVGRLQVPIPEAPHNPDRLPFRVVFDYGHDGVIRSVEDSLQRLGMNRIDIALIHDIDAYTHGEAGWRERFREALEGAFPALERLRAEGTVAAVGVGVNDWRVCQECLAAADVDCFLLAGQYTLLEQGALASLLPDCERRGVGVIVGSPFNTGILVHGADRGGRYFDGSPPPEVLARVRRMERICDGHGVSLAAAALRFPFGHPAVASVLAGVRGPEHVRRNLRWFAETVPQDLWLELKDEGLINADAPTPPSGGEP